MGPVVVSEWRPAPSSITPLTATPIAGEPRFALPFSATPPDTVPAPAVLPIVPVVTVTLLPTLAPPFTFNVFAPTAIKPVPPAVLFVTVRLPDEIVVPPS